MLSSCTSGIVSINEFQNNNFSPKPSIIIQQTTTSTPSPVQTIEASPSEDPSKSPESIIVNQYIIHKVKITTDHVSINKIAAYYNDVYSLNYPNTAIFVEVIAGLNEISDVNMVYVGQELRIPITPVPTTTQTPVPPPLESPEPIIVNQYIIHKVKITTDHVSINQIAAYYNDVYSLNYPNTAIFVEVIAGLNEISDVTMIYVGQELRIPITPVP